MALTTSKIDLTATWQVVSTGDSRFLAQIRSNTGVAIYVGSPDPTPTSPYISLNAGSDRSFPLDGITGEKVWARSLGESSSITVIKG